MLLSQDNWLYCHAFTYQNSQEFINITRIMLTIMLMLVLISTVGCQCYHSACRTCTSYYSSYCTSCVDNYYLYYNTCYSCQYCSYNARCPQCKITEEESTQDSSLIIFVIITAVFLGLAFVIYLVKRYNNSSNYLTQRQRQNAGIQSEVRLNNLETPAWKKASKKIDTEAICTICLDKGVFLETKCHHLFHPLCIETWAKKANNCPLCKTTQLNPCQLYCKQCFEQSIPANISSLSQINLVEFRCPSCRVMI